MAFTPEEINGKEFFITLRGYDKDEVRAFLSALAEEHQQLLQRAQVEGQASNASYESLGRGVGSVLEAANKAAEDMRREAEAEAEGVKRKAAADAAQVGAQAVARAREMAAESERRTVQELAAAEQRAQEMHDQSEARAAEIRAEAEKSVAEQRAAAAQQLRQAQQQTARLRDAAAAEVREAARRVQRLQQADVKFRQRLQEVQVELRSLLEDTSGAKQQQGQPPADGDGNGEESSVPVEPEVAQASIAPVEADMNAQGSGAPRATGVEDVPSSPTRSGPTPPAGHQPALRPWSRNNQSTD